MRFPLENSALSSCFAVTLTWSSDLKDSARPPLLVELSKLNSDEEGYLGQETICPVSGPRTTSWFWATRAQAESWKTAFAEEWEGAHPGQALIMSLHEITRDPSSPRVIALPPEAPLLVSFTDLAASRRSWIDEQLRPWCQQATRKDLLLAEADWVNIAGKVDAEQTLWAWAWSRFPVLVHEGLGIDESYRVSVTTQNGQRCEGYPDARESQQGMLSLFDVRHEPGNAGKSPVVEKPRFLTFSIDEIREIVRPAESVG